MKLSNAASFFGLLSFAANLVHAQEKSNLRKLQGQSDQSHGQGKEKTVKGTLNLVLVDYADGTDETVITVDEPDGTSYLTDLTEEWVKSVGAIPSKTQVEVTGLQIANEKVVKAQAKVFGGPNRELAERELTQYSTGTKTVLAVIIQDFSRNTGQQVPSYSAYDLANSVFGSLVGGNDPVNLASQYKLCSQDQLLFVPPSNVPLSKNQNSATDIVNGVTTVTVDTGCTTNACDNTLHNAATTAITNAFGKSPSSIADHVMYCLPPSSMGGIAYANLPGWRSVYSDSWCRYVSAQMHEIGHNIRFHHSNEGTTTYADQSGMMGYSYGSSDTPRMCFNAAKSWESNWFENNKVTFNVGSDSSLTIGLKGIATVDAASTSQKALVKINSSTSTDYYINFNHRTGYNDETQEGGNQVMIMYAGNEGAGGAESTLVAKLNALGTWTGTIDGISITVKVESINLSTGDAVICVSQAGSVCGTDAPVTAAPVTSSPTRAPTTPNPTAVPTPEPTPLTGFCTDGTGRCLPTNLSQCACAASGSQPEGLFRNLQSCSGLKSKDCSAPCIWNKGECLDPVASPPTSPPSPNPTSPPVTASPVTSNPTRAPATSSPTAPFSCGCSSTAVPTVAPTRAPSTSNPTREPTTSAPTRPCLVRDSECDPSTTCIDCCNGSGNFYSGRKGVKYCAT